MKQLPLFNRSFFSLSLGCALATLPLAVRAQDAPAAPETAPVGSDTAESAAGKTPAKADASQKFSESEKLIARKFADGNEGEIELAKLALTNAEGQDIKDFAQHMIDDHGKANEELVALANAHGMDLKPALTKAEHATYDKMKPLKGTNFDGVYAKHAVADHTEDVKEFQKAEKTIKDKDLLTYAEKALPIVEGHLKMAKELRGSGSAGGEAKTAKQNKQS